MCSQVSYKSAKSWWLMRTLLKISRIRCNTLIHPGSVIGAGLERPLTGWWWWRQHWLQGGELIKSLKSKKTYFQALIWMAPDVTGFLFARLPRFASIWATLSVHEDKATIHTHTHTDCGCVFSKMCDKWLGFSDRQGFYKFDQLDFELWAGTL